jgi:hypothetical protein
MARTNDLHKPGEKAPAKGSYVCYPCALQGIDSRCDLAAGDLFVACPKCLERKVAEWDLIWKPAAQRRPPLEWPGSLKKPA